MAVLLKVRRLVIRNGDDLTDVMHLMDNHSYVGKVIVPHEDIKDFLTSNLMMYPRGLQLLVYDRGYNSAEEVVREKERNVGDRSPDEDHFPPEKVCSPK